MDTLARKEETNQKLSALNISIMNELMNYLKKNEFSQFIKQHNAEHDKIQNKFKHITEQFTKKDTELNEMREHIKLRAMD